MEKFYKPLIAVITFYTMHYVANVIMHLVLIFYNIDFLKSWFTGTYTIEQILVMENPMVSGISHILSHIMVFYFLYVTTIARPETVVSTRHIRWKYVIPAIIFSFLMVIACDAYQSLLWGTLHEEVESYPSEAFTFISLCITGPIIEETIFRESIQGNLVRNDMKTWNAILVSATIFALLHFSKVDFASNFIFGIVSGMLYAKTRSITASSILHITNNTLAYILYADYTNAVSRYTSSMSGVMTYILVATLLFATSIYVLCIFWKSENK